MGLIRALARLFCGHQPEIDTLLRRIVFLNKKVADLTPVVQPKPEIEVLTLLPNSVKLDIQPLNLKMMYPALIDSQYYYTKAEDWAELFDYIYFKFDMPKYLADRQDCDDFAVLLKGLVASFFSLNYFAVVFGKSPGAYHAWNIFRDEQGLAQFEPQTGKYFPVGEKGYIPEYILL